MLDDPYIIIERRLLWACVRLWRTPKQRLNSSLRQAQEAEGPTLKLADDVDEHAQDCLFKHL